MPQMPLLVAHLLKTQMTTTRTARIPFWTWFIILMVPCFFHCTSLYLLFSKVSKLLGSNVWFRFNKYSD